MGPERVRRQRGPRRGRRSSRRSTRSSTAASRAWSPRPRSRRPGRASRARRTWAGSGFGFKWNMGWMHDTLAYFQHDPIYRRYHHHELTFSLVYAFTRELHPAALARRGRARQGLAAGQDAGRPLAEARQPALAVRLHVGAPRQEAAVHGPGVRARSRSGARAARSTGTCSRTPSTPACSRSCATSTASTATSRRCGSWTSTPRASGGSRPTTPTTTWSRSPRRTRDAERIALFVANLSPVPRDDYRLGLPRSGRWLEALNTDSELLRRLGRRATSAASRPRRSAGTASRSRPRSRCRRWPRCGSCPRSPSTRRRHEEEGCEEAGCEEAGREEAGREEGLIAALNRRRRFTSSSSLGTTDSRSSAGPGVVVHRGPPLHPDDLTIQNGIPVTSPSRTLIDCAEVSG